MMIIVMRLLAYNNLTDFCSDLWTFSCYNTLIVK